MKDPLTTQAGWRIFVTEEVPVFIRLAEAAPSVGVVFFDGNR